MAKYAADCCVCFSVCIPENCRCRPYCDEQDCKENFVKLNELAECIEPSRVLAATVGPTSGGVVVNFNGDNPGVDYSIEARGGRWKLYGPAIDDGGTVEICLQLKPPTQLWQSAVASWACKLVPCVHATGCSGDFVTSETNDGITRTFVSVAELLALGLKDDKFANQLDPVCAQEERVVLGAPSTIRYIRWAACA